MGRGSSQIFTDKLFQVRLAAECLLQHRLPEEISLFFSRRRRWGHWFLNLCASVEIRVQDND
jgi:hypothetical protein